MKMQDVSNIQTKLQYEIIVSSLYSYTIHMLDIDYISSRWTRMTLSDKIDFFKRSAIECTIMCSLSIAFFWITLLTLWAFTFIVSPDPYIQQYTPSYHIQTLKDTSLVTVFINNLYKQQICTVYADSLNYFDQLTITHSQFCNIQQNALPTMSNNADIGLKNIDYRTIKYIKGCLKYPSRQLSCQKYIARQSMVLFRQINLLKLEYFYLQLELIEKDVIPLQGMIIEFEENCWYVTKLFKDHYRLFTLIYSYGVTILLTICIILARIFYLVRKFIKEEKQLVITNQRQKQRKIREREKEMQVQRQSKIREERRKMQDIIVNNLKKEKQL